MKRVIWRWLFAAALLACLALLGFRCVHWLRWRERPDPVTGVTVELSPHSQTIRIGERLVLDVTLVNRGTQDVVLVEPGDGSLDGWRTPIIEWSRDFEDRSRRCGNVGSLQPDEVFTLKPGEARQLRGSVRLPQPRVPGSYRIALRYTNRPDLEWIGVPLGAGHDPGTMEAVQMSTPVSAVSNSVELIVTE
jgi:hypothetical protein